MRNALRIALWLTLFPLACVGAIYAAPAAAWAITGIWWLP